MSHQQVPFSADSGVWARSAGDVFPYIVYGQQADADSPIVWGVMGGDVEPQLIGSWEEAYERAVELKQARELLAKEEQRPVEPKPWDGAYERMARAQRPIWARDFPPVPSPIKGEGVMADRARAMLEKEQEANKSSVDNALREMLAAHNRKPYNLKQISERARYAVARGDLEDFIAVVKFARLHFLIEF